MDNTINLIKAVQTKLNLLSDGDAGPVTWKAIVAHLGIVLPNEMPLVTTISDAAYALIIKYEVGGGQQYYNSQLKSPEFPGGSSGVTIGCGYDLGVISPQQFESDWKSLLSSDVFNTLSSHLGKTGDAAKAVISSLKNIAIPWESAELVFKTRDIPRYIKETITAFPGSDKLKPDAFGSLVSLVFNRGGSVMGDSRREMRNIRDAISGNISVDNIYDFISRQIISMKYLWINSHMQGLLDRRDEEAALVKSCQ